MVERKLLALDHEVLGVKAEFRVISAAWLSLAAVAAGAQPGDDGWDKRFFLSGVTAPVGSFAVEGTNLYVCGQFRFADGLLVNGVSRWDGVRWWSFGTGIDGVPLGSSPIAVAAQGSNVYVGGYFTSVSGVRATNIA